MPNVATDHQPFREDAAPELIYQHPRLAVWLLNDHLITANFPLHSLRLYNPSAAALWLLLIDGQQDQDGLIAAYASLFRLSLQKASADVVLCLTEWTELGWLDDNQGGGLRIAPQPISDTLPDNTVECSEFPAHRVLLNELFQLGNTVFGLRVAEALPTDLNPPANSVLATRMAAMLLGFPIAGPAAVPKHQLNVVVSQDAIYMNDGTASYRKVDAAEALGQVMLAIFRIAYPQEKMLGTLHAAAIGKRGALLLSGVSGAGKSTLSAYLVSRGWAYYGDDIVGLSAAGRVLPFPASASIKEGSWSALGASFPELAQLETLSTGLKTVRYLPLACSAEADESARSVAGWVFPRYLAGAETRFEAMDAVTALQSLIGAGFSLEGQHGFQGVGQFIDLLARVPRYRLVYSDLNEAQECLQSLLTP